MDVETTPISLRSEAAKKAIDKMMSDIDAAMIKAFDDGWPYFAVCEKLEQEPQDYFAVRNIFAPQVISVTRKAGPVDDLVLVPFGFRVAARPEDWAERRDDYINGTYMPEGVKIDHIGGQCPVQAEGTVDGKRFYFRARGQRWQFTVAETDNQIFTDNLFYTEHPYGEGKYDAGWMSAQEAQQFIVQGVREFRAQGEAK